MREARRAAPRLPLVYLFLSSRKSVQVNCAWDDVHESDVVRETLIEPKKKEFRKLELL